MVLKFKLIRVESESGASYAKYRNTENPKVEFHLLLNSENGYSPKEFTLYQRDNHWSLIDSEFTPTISKENGKTE